MKILYSAMPFDNGKSGISDYIYHTIHEMSQDNELVIYGLESDKKHLPLNKNCQFKKISDVWSSPLLNIIWHLVVLPFISVFSKTDYIFLPAGNRRVMSFYPKVTVTTVHDLAQFHLPQKYDGFRMYYVKKLIPLFLTKATRIIAISQSTKKDLEKYFKIKPEKIIVNYNGYNQKKFIPLDVNNARTIVKKELDIEYNYLLYISRLEHPGKNHINLIKAYQKLPSVVQQHYKLVLAGCDWSGSEKIKEYVKEQELEKQVIFTGFVDTNVLPALYSAASLYICPSLFEGFGIPILEAMASGIPTICSNRSALPEIGGPAVQTFDPENVNAIVNTILNVLLFPKKSQKMKALGYEWINQFQWRTHSEKITACFQ